MALGGVGRTGSSTVSWTAGLGPEPRHWHLPLVVGPDGRRLAKRHGDTRVEHYRRQSVPAEAIIGLVAGWSGCEPVSGKRGPMSVPEFARMLDASKIPHTPVVFGPEDDRWLLSQATG